jgi:hypothetical protein
VKTAAVALIQLSLERQLKRSFKHKIYQLEWTNTPKTAIYKDENGTEIS